MKTKHALTALLLSLATAQLRAGNFTEAEFTRLYNEVKVLKSDAAPKDAVVGGKVDAVTSVATGADSRAEMRFPDKSLTRLGANSRFTLKGEQRILELDQGVMLLQVPKMMGGAKVRTAAVTAAVTGTTVLFEYVTGGYVKLIVIEGSVDLYFNDKPGKYKTATSGQMFLLKVDEPKDGFIPNPVDVDLNLLLKTSKLISANDIGTPNLKQVAQAVEDQKKKMEDGDLVKTNLLIPGRGTQVAIITSDRTEVIIKDDDTPPKGNPNPSNPGQPQTPNTPTPLSPLISGTTVLGDSSEVRTHPHVDAYNSLYGYGTYAGTEYIANVPYSKFAFGTTVPLENPEVQQALNSAGIWAAYKFENLLINGTPYFNIQPNDIHDIIFTAVNDLRLADENPYGEPGPETDGPPITSYYYEGARLDLDESNVDNLVLYAQNGNVTLADNFSIYGYDTNVSLVSANADVLIQGDIDLGFYNYEGEGSNHGGELTVSAGRDIIVSNDVNAGAISAAAGRDIQVSQSNMRADTGIKLTAKRNITVDSSATLQVLSNNPGAVLQLISQGGNVDITGNGYCANLQGKTIDIQANGPNGNINLNSVRNGSSEVFKAQTLGTNGWITIGNSNLTATQIMKIYAQGSNGGVRFDGNSTLDSSNIHIAGKTVDVTTGTTVTVKGGASALNVYTDNAQFNTVSRDLGKGSFKDNGGNTIEVPEKAFNHPSRPQY